MATTYKGVTMPFAKCSTDPLEQEMKETSYPGVDGLQWMHLGERGRSFSIRGTSVGGSPSKATLDAMADGALHTLIVNGTSYSNVYCFGVTFGPEFTDQNGPGFHFVASFRQVEA